ncbi:DeoR/GlpR family DNA-binding transcription regulator [uncultured Paludibaculum sp.]|uniref:DeoR/GlpR family DNA-binding transcription regulator n=1 Tax=uncultured Paludibaculum sp. TaxID=1765020 RepID=UPI002AAAEC13|nr:DeoR/GlpR family DNA-binding transcription regulator [uncultured Paludibaculum sp.]
MAKPSRLLVEERRRKILDMVNEAGRVTAAEIVRRFGVSAVTARTDLNDLAESGSLVRSHGGAVSPQEPTRDYPVSLKAILHHEEKVRIGQAAARLVRRDETVILDNGTTTLEIARHLKARRVQGITVITNALNIASELADCPGMTLIMVGGLLRQISCSFVGPQAEAMLTQLHADRLFLAVDGFELETGPSTPDVLEAHLNECMMSAARETTVVADHSKLGRRSVYRIGTVDRVQRLITDAKAQPEFLESMRRLGIEVVVA